MKIPSTPTASDALLERKKILEENAILIQQRDTLRQEVEGLRVSRDQEKEVITKNQEGAHAQHAVLLENYNTLKLQNESFTRVNDELQQRVEKLSQEKSALDKTIDEMKIERGTMAEKIEVVRRDLQHAISEKTKFENTANLAKSVLQIDLQALEKNIQEANTLLAETEETERSAKQRVYEEDQRISTQLRDLRIYAQRIAKLAQTLGVLDQNAADIELMVRPFHVEQTIKL